MACRGSPLLLVTALACLVTVCRPCSLTNWRPMSLSEQAAEAEIVLYGTVTAHYPLPDVPSEYAYIAEMDVHCTLKGDDIPPRVNISDAGRLTSCDHTDLPVGRPYITLVKELADGRLVPDEVNYLSVAFRPTRDTFEEVDRGVEGSLCRCVRQMNGTEALDWDILYDDDDDGEGRCGGATLRAALAAVLATAAAAFSLNQGLP